MFSEPQTRNRTYLLCPVCKRTQWSLPVHLRRSCMKDSPAAHIEKFVSDAKKEANQILRQGRIWDYSLIRRILDDADPVSRLIKELQDRGNVVNNVPPVDPASALAASQSVTPGSLAVDPKSEAGSDSSGGPSQCHVTIKQTTSMKMATFDESFYGKHSIHHPLLKSFSEYLEEDLANQNSQQEVEHVCRFLYFMDPQQPSFKFVRQHERAREYFTKLSEVGLSEPTVQKYLKSIKRFLKFHVGSTSLSFDDRLNEDCKNFMMFLSNIEMAMEDTRRRSDSRNKGEVSFSRCLAVLDAAKKDFLAVMEKLDCPGGAAGHQLTKAESRLVLYYLQAVLILQHLQWPSVVENMTVSEWVLRRRVLEHGGHVVVRVKERKSSARQVAVFALSQEEETWFELYYTELRPVMFSRKRKRMEVEEDEAEEKFFISSNGNGICSASSDLERLHKKYLLPNVTSQMARRAIEVAARKLTDSEKSLLSDYLSYKADREAENAVGANLRFRRLISDSDGEERGQPTGRAFPQMESQAAYNRLIQSFPVTIDGAPPKRSVRASLTGPHERHCYDCWRRDQLQLRVRRLLEHFGQRLPSESRVHSWIQKQGWTTNVPDAALVVEQWKPCGGVDTAMDSRAIQKLTRTQKWKGLVLADTEGRGVLTTRPFARGEVVCDYHGRQVSRQEGLNIHQTTTEEERVSMFFYKDTNGQEKCIDAREDHCECHPDRMTFGRRINHSSKKANLRPRLYCGEDRDTILFIACKDIGLNEELRFDYGTRKKAFAGEGLDLHWL